MTVIVPDHLIVRVGNLKTGEYDEIELVQTWEDTDQLLVVVITLLSYPTDGTH